MEEQVEVAVRSLHVPNIDATTRQQALNFLERFQNTVRASLGWRVEINDCL